MSIIAGRTTSAFPVSIGTSMFLESIMDGPMEPYDKERQRPQLVDLKEYDIWYVSLSTLIRNLIGSLGTKLPLGENGELGPTIVGEIEIIREVAQSANPDLDVVVYWMEEKDILRMLRPPVVVRNQDSPSRLSNRMYGDIVVKWMQRSGWFKNVLTTRSRLPVADRRVLVTTHAPWDLLNYRKFKKFDLLESHTGKLKPPTEFGSKYHPLGKLRWVQMPFMEKLYYLLGDSVYVVPVAPKLRRIIHGVAVERRWTPLTSQARIEKDLKTLCGKEIADLVIGYPRYF